MMTKMNLSLILITIKLLIIWQQMIVTNGIPIEHKVITNNQNIKTQFEYVLRQQINELKTLLQQKTSKFDGKTQLRPTPLKFYLIQSFYLIYKYNNLFEI